MNCNEFISTLEGVYFPKQDEEVIKNAAYFEEEVDFARSMNI
jgi:hypothetical protein